MARSNSVNPHRAAEHNGANPIRNSLLHSNFASYTIPNTDLAFDRSQTFSHCTIVTSVYTDLNEEKCVVLNISHLYFILYIFQIKGALFGATYKLSSNSVQIAKNHDLFK